MPPSNTATTLATSMGATATYGNDAVHAGILCQFDRIQYHRLRRVFPYLVVEGDADAVGCKSTLHRLHQADGHQARIGNEQRPGDTQPLALLMNFQAGTAAALDAAGGAEGELLHWALPFRR